MEKAQHGCPVEFRKFGYVCIDCGAADFGGRDLCASKAQRMARRRKAMLEAGAECPADKLTGARADAVVCDEVEAARQDLGAVLEGLVAALVKQQPNAAITAWDCIGHGAGPDLGAAGVEITRQDDQAPVYAEARPMPVLEVPEDAPRVIGLCGLAGSGKSTAAEFLEGLGYTRIAFADPLKAMLRALLASAGVPDWGVERMLAGDLKEVPAVELWGRSARYAMQTLGTEWGRKLMHPEFWVQIGVRRACDILDAGGRVVFEDVRMANEAAAVRQMGGGSQVWQVKGRAAEIAKDGAFHASERLEAEPDLVLDNSGDLERLEAQILEHILG